MRDFFSETDSPSVSRDVFIASLTSALGSAECLRLSPSSRAVYESDGLSAYKQLPWVVALPETAAQIQQILRVCSELKVPVVPRGAGTGLSGGALPHPTGLLLSTARMNSLEIDEKACLARVGPGVRNLQVSEAASEFGLYYAPDPSSQIACSIGGNIAENSGGVHCLKYGLTVHNVIAIDVLTIEGELLTLSNAAPAMPGGNALALSIGSEGMFGIVVSATLKLLPKPPTVKVIMAAFANVRDAGQAVADIIARGVIPAGLEMMDGNAVVAVEDFAKAGYPRDAAALLLCELDGEAESVEQEQRIVMSIFAKRRVTSTQIAEDAEQRARLWLGRKSAFTAVGKLSPDYYCMDGTIPRRHLPTVLEYINQRSKHWGLGVANVFHAGDGNLHPLIFYDASKENELERAEKFGADILKKSVELGGTITGEHGVGIEKIDQMCVQFTAAELQQFHELRKAFDPLGLLNPGKAIPTLNRCAEFGAMHVHSDAEQAHGGLPRF